MLRDAKGGLDQHLFFWTASIYGKRRLVILIRDEPCKFHGCAKIGNNYMLRFFQKGYNRLVMAQQCVRLKADIKNKVLDHPAQESVDSIVSKVMSVSLDGAERDTTLEFRKNLLADILEILQRSEPEEWLGKFEDLHDKLKPIFGEAIQHAKVAA